MSRLGRRRSFSPNVFNVHFPAEAVENTPFSIVNVFLREKKQRDYSNQKIKAVHASRAHFAMVKKEIIKKHMFLQSRSRRNLNGKNFSSLRELMQPYSILPRINTYNNRDSTESNSSNAKYREEHRKLTHDDERTANLSKKLIMKKDSRGKSILSSYNWAKRAENNIASLDTKLTKSVDLYEVNQRKIKKLTKGYGNCFPKSDFS
jgi:hypothetical protein